MAKWQMFTRRVLDDTINNNITENDIITKLLPNLFRITSYFSKLHFKNPTLTIKNEKYEFKITKNYPPDFKLTFVKYPSWANYDLYVISRDDDNDNVEIKRNNKIILSEALNYFNKLEYLSFFREYKPFFTGNTDIVPREYFYDYKNCKKVSPVWKESLFSYFQTLFLEVDDHDSIYEAVTKLMPMFIENIVLFYIRNNMNFSYNKVYSYLSFQKSYFSVRCLYQDISFKYYYTDDVFNYVISILIDRKTLKVKKAYIDEIDTLDYFYEFVSKKIDVQEIIDFNIARSTNTLIKHIDKRIVPDLYNNVLTLLYDKDKYNYDKKQIKHDYYIKNSYTLDDIPNKREQELASQIYYKFVDREILSIDNIVQIVLCYMINNMNIKFTIKKNNFYFTTLANKDFRYFVTNKNYITKQDIYVDVETDNNMYKLNIHEYKFGSIRNVSVEYKYG